MSQVIVGKIVEIVEHPFGKGPLTSDGVQYSAEVTSTANTYKTVEKVTIDEIGVTGGPGGRGTIIEGGYAVTWGMHSSGSADKATGLISAQDKDNGTYVVLMTAQETATASTAYEYFTYSGRFASTATFTKVPFDMKVEVKSSGTTDNAVGKVKNSSYVSVVYKIA